MKRLKKLAVVLMMGVLIAGLVKPVVAHEQGVDYQYLVGSGVVCGLALDACPVIVMSSNGDTIELVGEGTFNTHSKEATGEGNFVHKDDEGNIIGTGTWHTEELLKFKSWGSGVPQGTPPEFEGGRAKLAIHLQPDGGGEGFHAKLYIICTLGKFPASAHEGVELTIQHAPNFSESVSGFTLFIRQ